MHPLAHLSPEDESLLAEALTLLQEAGEPKDLTWLTKRSVESHGVVEGASSHLGDLHGAVEKIEELPLLLGRLVTTAVFVESRKEQKRLERLFLEAEAAGLVERISSEPATYLVTGSGSRWLSGRPSPSAFHGGT